MEMALWSHHFAQKLRPDLLSTSSDAAELADNSTSAPRGKRRRDKDKESGDVNSDSEEEGESKSRSRKKKKT